MLRAFALRPSPAKPAPPPMLRAFALRPSPAQPAPPPMLRAFALRPSRAKPAPPPMLRAFALRPSRAKPAPPSQLVVDLGGAAELRHVVLALVEHRLGGELVADLLLHLGERLLGHL